MFVSNLYLHLPTYIQLFLLITTCLHLTQVSIILIIKLCFSLYTLILKKKKFEVRNSPLNKYASLISQALYCMKFGCAVAGAGAPIFMILTRSISTSTPFKDMFTLTIGGGSQAARDYQAVTDSSNTVNSIIFLSSLNKKIPNWLKISFKILFVTLIVLKLFGFSFGSAFLYVLSINVYYIKVAFCIIYFLRICYNLLNLYLLHKFSNKNIKISKVLPEYLIQRLKEIEIMSKTKPGIAAFKSNCYLDISIYLILLSITIIITYLF